MRVFPRPVWVLKNCLIIVIGVVGCVFGTVSSIWSIVDHYHPAGGNSTASLPFSGKCPTILS